MTHDFLATQRQRRIPGTDKEGPLIEIAAGLQSNAETINFHTFTSKR